MAALSSADKLRLKLSRERLERWERERRKPAVNEVVTPSGKVKPVERCNNVFAPGRDKPAEKVKPDRLDSVHRSTDGFTVRTMAGKLGRHGNAIAARVHTIRHLRADGSIDAQIVHDCAENDSAPVDPAWKAGQRSTVKKASPFRKGLYSRAKSATFSVEHK